MPRLLASTRRAPASVRRTAAAPPGTCACVQRTSPPWTETTSGRRSRVAQHGVAGGHGVVGVDHVERPGPAQGERQRRRGPRPPPGVGPRAAGGDVADVAHDEAVAELDRRLSQKSPELVSRKGRRRRNKAVEDENADIGPGVARRHRLTVGPDAEHGVARTRIELCDYGYPHRRCTARVRCDSAAGR